MKTIAIITVLLLLQTCEESLVINSQDKININQVSEKSEESEKNFRSTKPLFYSNSEVQLSGVIQSKTFYEENEFYELHFTYPYLEGENNSAFNEYIDNNYLNIEALTSQILDDKEMRCNDYDLYCGKDKKFLEYKVHLLSDKMLSIILLQENFYAGAAHSSYKFECLNYALNSNTFLKFNDVFKENTKELVLDVLNKKISISINDGSMYYECWELTSKDFYVYKDNFVMDKNSIVYYFDDCIICPAYTGTYFVEIPIKEVMHLLKIYSDTEVITI